MFSLIPEHGAFSGIGGVFILNHFYLSEPGDEIDEYGKMLVKFTQSAFPGNDEECHIVDTVDQSEWSEVLLDHLHRVIQENLSDGIKHFEETMSKINE